LKPVAHKKSVQLEHRQFLREALNHPVMATILAECLSLVELTGTKYILALPAPLMTADVLEHANDELRHSKVMADEVRRLRQTLSARDLVRERDTSPPCLAATELYLGSLLKKVFRRVCELCPERPEKAWGTYLAVSLTIERRLMKIYPQVAAAGLTESLRATGERLMKEEVDHLRHVSLGLAEATALARGELEGFVEIEARLAEEWFAALATTFAERLDDDAALVSWARRSLHDVQAHALARPSDGSGVVS
jgi:hypothetical protein